MYTCKEIANCLGATTSNPAPVLGFCQDSRLVQKGDLFFALPGSRVEGHVFLSEVARKGAVAAVVSRDYRGKSYGLTLLYVQDVMSSLHLLAHHLFSQRKTRVIAVTGSVGKTTVKEFIATLLSADFQVVRTPGNANSQIGLPLALLNADAKAEVLVAEMGMDQKGQIAKLAAIASPEVVLITNIGLAHSANFPEGEEGIAKAKAEILSNRATRLAILGAKVENFSCIRKSSLPKKTYGLGKGSDLYIKKHGKRGYFIAKESFSPSFSLPFEAEHLWENFCGAALVARELGLSWEKIIKQAEHLKLASHRCNIIEKEKIIFVDDSYNASLSSMKAAFNSLPRTGGKTIAVIGDMKELGRFSSACHLEVAHYALEVIDVLLCLGDGCAPMVDVFKRNQRKAYLYASFEEVYQAVYDIAEPGDVVLVKGANSHQLWRILN